MAARKKSSKTKRKSKTVPLSVLESRAAYLVEVVKRRGGKVRKSVKLTHRTPKQAAKVRTKTRKAKRKALLTRHMSGMKAGGWSYSKTGKAYRRKRRSSKRK